jgi:VanZ family protein
MALAIAAPVEYAQRFIGGRYPDLTDIALSVAGAWLGLWTATEGWRRFDAERALTSPR